MVEFEFNLSGSRPSHLPTCLISHIPTSVITGTLMGGFNIASGAPASIGLFVNSIGFIYAYHALICPLEAIQGRQSLAHNAFSGGTLGYIAVQRFGFGVPFVPPHLLMGNRYLKPAYIGALGYGGMAAVFAGVGGKRF